MSTSRPSKRQVGPPSRPQWAMTWREGASTRTGPNDVPFGVSSRYRSVSSRPHTDLPSPTSVIHGNDDDGIVHEPTSASGGHLPSSSKVEEERGLGPPLTACPTRDLSVTQWAEDTSAAQRRDVWRQPYFQPSKVHEEMLQRESIRPPVFGGRSKNQQLGSVSESWGAKPTLEIPKGMFELEDDPPSPTFASHMTHQEIQAEKARRAALGIPAEKSGRPSIKDMEKERLEKLKYQQLRDERAKNGVTLAELRAAVEEVDTSAYTPPTVHQPSATSQASPILLSEKLRQRDLEPNTQGDEASDGW